MLQDVVLPIAVFLLSLGLGLSLSVSDFLRLRHYWRPFIATVISMLAVVPLAGLGIVSVFGLPPALAIGVMMIATAPGGLFSNLLTHMGGGNLALSVTLTATLSLIYVFEVPFVAAWLHAYFLGTSTTVDVPPGMIALPLFALTLLPISLGMVLKARQPAVAALVDARLRQVSAAFIVIVFAGLAFAERARLIESLALSFLPVLTLNLSALAIGNVTARLFGARPEDQIAITVEHSVRQEGTAIYIAATIFSNAQMALPIILNSGIGMIVSISFITIFRRIRSNHEARSMENYV